MTSYSYGINLNYILKFACLAQLVAEDVKGKAAVEKAAESSDAEAKSDAEHQKKKQRSGSDSASKQS